MKLEILESGAGSIRFLLKGATNAYANAIRRVASNHVQSFAIDRCTFYENSSAMFDEYIAHRIGLVPILTPDGYTEKDEILFTLDATGPKTVYSKELESKDKEVRVANENVPIIKLGAEQRLRLDGKAVLGTGARHAKFQPCLITFDQKKEGEFEFYVESFGQIPSEEIVNKAFNRIKEEVKEIEKSAKKL